MKGKMINMFEIEMFDASLNGDMFRCSRMRSYEKEREVRT